jgi:hypothetical protein
MDNNLPTDDNQKPVTPVETPPTENPSVIPETPKETPPITFPEEPKQETPETTIEIGSLGQPSLSTLQDVGDKSSNKAKKIKNAASILGLLLIIVSLPLTVLLVKQRQEIRKEAAVSQGTLNICGITVGQPTENKGSGTYSITVPIKNTRTDTAKVEIHTYACACTEGNLSQCGTSKGKCESTNEVISLSPGESRNYQTATARQSNGQTCGTFQADFFIVSVNGDTNCRNN